MYHIFIFSGECTTFIITNPRGKNWESTFISMNPSESLFARITISHFSWIYTFISVFLVNNTSKLFHTKPDTIFYLLFKFVIYEKLTSFFLLWQIQFEFEIITVLALWRQYENWTEYYFNILNEAKCLELEFPWWRARERFREK